jgi:hypothetical protein
MSPITKAIIAMITFVLSISGAIIAAEDRYVSCDELKAHSIAVNNIMVNKELSYAIARCAKLKEQLIHGQDNYRLRIELDTCIIQRDALRMELQ